MGANYRACCRGRSKADFVNKRGIVIEEADGTLFWLEIIHEKGVLRSDRVGRLLREADELVAVFVAGIRTAKGDA